MKQSDVTRRKALGRLLAVAVAISGTTGATLAQAQKVESWPEKPIRLVVPYAAGGFADLRARQLGIRLNKSLGVNVIVDNKAGAGGVVGTDVIAKAAPDGYTIGMGNLAPLSVNVSLMKSLPYDPAKDLAPVVLIERAPLILMTHPSTGFKTVADLISAAKAKPGSFGFASSGVGGAHHLSGEMFKMIAGIDLTHVPYKGGGPAAADLVAGHVPLMFELGYSALPNLRANKVVPLAVSSAQRMPQLPDVPTMQEAGVKGFESYNWQGVVVPAGTPPAIIAKLNKAFNDALADPEVKKSIEDTGAQIVGGTPEAFGAFIRSETEVWAKVVKAAKIEPQ